MICFPNAKINIGLHVVSRRKDGYHNLETVFYPIGLKDALEIIPSPENSGEEIKFSKSMESTIKSSELSSRKHRFFQSGIAIEENRKPIW